MAFSTGICVKQETRFWEDRRQTETGTTGSPARY